MGGVKRNLEKYSDKYLESPFTKENAEYRRRCVIEQMRKYPHKHILEIGCGMYPVFAYIDFSEYEDYTVIEPGEMFVQNAVDIILKRGLQDRINVQQVFFEDALLNIKYDFIICSSLLHEVADSNRILKKLFEVADLNTVVHINVPNAFSFHRILAKEMGMIQNEHELSERNKNLQQCKVYDMASLKSQLLAMGFLIVEKGSYFIKPFTHKQMANMLDEGIIDERVLEGLWNLCKYFPTYGSEIYINMKKG